MDSTTLVDYRQARYGAFTRAGDADHRGAGAAALARRLHPRG